MKLTLTGNTKVREVKNQFSQVFPFLKLEFFTQGQQEGGGSALAQKTADQTPLATLAPPLRQAVVSFTPTTTVAELEQRLQCEYGLPVHVFRKAGNLWHETVQTESLTLEKQNAIGRDVSSPIRFNIHTLFL